MPDNFGSNYQVGGFGQGFLQGMSAINQQKELQIRQEQAQREQETFQRGKNKADLLGNLHELQNASTDYQQGIPVDAQGILDRNDEVSMRTGAPSIRQMLNPQFDEWKRQSQGAMQNPAQANSPDFVKSANWRFNNELNEPNGETLDRDVQGTDGISGQPMVIPKGAKRVHTEFSGFHPGQVGVDNSPSIIPDLNVHFAWTGKDGKSYHGVVNDPMTEGRSVLASDDKIKQINFHDFADNVTAESYMHQAISDPSVKSALEGMVLRNGGTYDDLYPTLKGQDIKYIYNTSDGSRGVPKGVPVVQSAVVGKDGKMNIIGESDATAVSQRLGGIYNPGIMPAQIRAGATVDSARIRANGPKGGGSKGAANVEALAQSYMEGDPNLNHSDAYSRADAVINSGKFTEYLKSARDEVKKSTSPFYGMSPGTAAKEMQKSAVQTRVSLGKPNANTQVPIESRTKELVDQEKAANNGQLNDASKAKIKAQLMKEYPNG